MKISAEQHRLIVSALHTLQKNVISRHDKDAADVSEKWNDFREQRALRLLDERDKLDELIKLLSASQGTFSW